MPIGLVMFGDKSHLDLHGALATTPISFTLSIFNKASRNMVKFWRPVAYIPNLGHENFTSGVESTEKSRASVDDENRCLSVALAPLRKLHLDGGFRTTTLGRVVKVKVWIHFIIGDMQGNNRWLAHYNSYGNVKRPYRDCKCSYADMASSNPNCV